MKSAFLNLKVSAKLLISFSVLTVITLAVGGLGILNIVRLQAMDQDLYTYQTLPLLELRVIHGSFEQNQVYIRDIILEDDPALQDFHLQAINENRQKIDRALETFSASLLTQEEKQQFVYLANVVENFNYHLDQVMELCRNGNETFAYTVLAQDGPKLSQNFSKAMDTLSEIKEKTGHNAALTNKARAESAIWQTLIFVIAAGLLAVIFVYVIARLISTPLAALAEAAAGIAKGNLTQQIPEKYRTNKDEIGQLGLVFFTMTANLKDLIAKIYQSAELVASSSEELNASAAHAAQTGTEVAHTVTITAEGTRKQADALTETTTTVQTMADAVRQIASNGANAADVAEKAVQAALSGGKKIETVIAKMTDIKNSVEHSAAVVTGLGARSHEIGQIVSTISGLASQTNLLALNAAIEAARAGEEGRGFAVVADEVRKLAEQSQAAAEQITALIHSIQLDTGKAVTAMHEGTGEVQTGYVVVNEAGEAFTSIAGLVQTASEQIRAISSAVEGIASGSQRIVDSVHEVEQVSLQTLDQTQTVSAATQEQSSVMEEIAASCDVLAQLADQMQQAISQFKIK